MIESVINDHSMKHDASKLQYKELLKSTRR